MTTATPARRIPEARGGFTVWHRLSGHAYRPVAHHADFFEAERLAEEYLDAAGLGGDMQTLPSGQRPME